MTRRSIWIRHPEVRLEDRTARWVGVVLAVVVAAMVMQFGVRRSGGIVPVSGRRPMPLLEMSQMDGGTWRMVDHRGQVVIVNYWASWCQPCWEETPGLVRLSREMGPKVAVVGVAMDESGTEKVRSFVQRFGVPYTVVTPGHETQMAYGMDGLPRTILVDRQGRVAKTYPGAVEERDLREDVGALLAER